MPDLTTHFLFAKEVLKEADPKTVCEIQLHSNVFYFGAQGPDLFFFRKPITKSSPLPQYGNLLHETKIEETFLFFRAYLKKETGISRNILNSYCSGYLCHYLLDKTVHPYVYALQEQIKKQNVKQTDHEIHAKIESELDSVLYPYFEKDFITNFPLKRYLSLTDEESLVLSQLYRSLLKEVYGITVSSAEIEDAMKDLISFSKLLYDRHGILFHTMKLSAKVIPPIRPFFAHMKTKRVTRDILNLSHHIWQNPNPPCQSSNASVLDLWKQAKEEAKAVLSPTQPFLSPSVTVDFNGTAITE
jgi:hypothetical protein